MINKNRLAVKIKTCDGDGFLKFVPENGGDESKSWQKLGFRVVFVYSQVSACVFLIYLRILLDQEPYVCSLNRSNLISPPAAFLKDAQ